MIKRVSDRAVCTVRIAAAGFFLLTSLSVLKADEPLVPQQSADAGETVAIPQMESLGTPAPATSATTDTYAPSLLNRPLSDIRPTLDYAWGKLPSKKLPDDFHESINSRPYAETVGSAKVLHWVPTNLWYFPLYFEDPVLERYGHTRRPLVQPLISAGRFIGQTAALPYQAGIHSPCCPTFALGFYQPGECAPKLRYRIPRNSEAAAHEALWVIGLVLLIP